MTAPADVVLAVEAGADAVGVILAESERRVTLAIAREIASSIPPYVSGIGVLADDTSPAAALRELGFRLQFSAPVAPEECERLAGGLPYLKTFFVGAAGEIESGAPEADMRAYSGALWMFDSASPGRFGGSGIAFRWETLAEIARERPVVVSGGLTADNVGTLVRSLRPFGVDVRSGIERDGRKDLERMRAFVRAVREADATTAP